MRSQTTKLIKREPLDANVQAVEAGSNVEVKDLPLTAEEEEELDNLTQNQDKGKVQHAYLCFNCGLYM